MELKVIGKRLFTNGLDGAITEGENRADVIGITLERYHGSLDLSEFSFRITAVSEENGAAAEQLLEKDSVTDSEIHLLWTVTSDFTAESGSYAITLAGVDSDNVTQIKFTARPVNVGADSRMEFLPHPTIIEQYLNRIQLEVQNASDAAKRAEEAANGAIPTASESKLGGIKAGGDISVAADGIVTVNSVKGKTVGASVPADAKFTDTVYSLPAASENTLGGVKPDGTTISAGTDGTISVKDNSHGHTVGNVAGLQNALDKKADISAIPEIPAALPANGGNADTVGGFTVKAGVPADAKFTDTVYTLPAASETVLGGVKPDGATISAGSDGTVSVRANSHSHSVSNITGLQAALDGKADISAIPEIPAALPADGGNADTVGGFTVKTNVPANAKFTDTVYTLPKADESTLGGVIPDGKTIIADENGVITAKGGSEYVLPAATASTLGGVRVDGVTITSDENGVISAIGGGPSGSGGTGDYVLPVATASTLGGVMPDGTTISAGKNGVISVEDNSHSHTISNVAGLQSALNSKADISAIPEIPAALPADGGNADTVGGFTVKASVPANAKFTDTVYTLPKATVSTLGGVILDGETITADENGVITAKTGNEYVLPAAAENTLGGVKPDGSTITANSGGVISLSGAVSERISNAEKNISDHAASKANPHSVTKAQLGLGNVENKSSAAIRGEITKENVTAALGYTPPTTNTTYSAATATANGLMSSGDKSKLDGIAAGAQVNTVTGVKGSAETAYRTGQINLTPANIGAAAESHTHNYAGSSSAGGAAASALACTGNSATATKATQDSAGQQINTTYIKGLSVSGKTITYTKGNGTTGTITTQDTVYTLPKATASTLGGVKPDGKTISVDGNGVISAASAGGNLIIDKLFEKEYFEGTTDTNRFSAGYITVPKPFSYYDYIVVSGLYVPSAVTKLGRGGTIVVSAKQIHWGTEVNKVFDYYFYTSSTSDKFGYFRFISDTVMYYGQTTDIVVFGIKTGSSEMLGVGSLTAPTA